MILLPELSHQGDDLLELGKILHDAADLLQSVGLGGWLKLLAKLGERGFQGSEALFGSSVRSRWTWWILLGAGVAILDHTR